MLRIDFDNPDKEAVIQECKEYIHLLEYNLQQIEETLKAECEKTNDLYGQILQLEEEIRNLEGQLSWVNEGVCY